jgi:hypothetical protein
MIIKTAQKQAKNIFRRYSSWRKLLRVVTYTLKFVKNALCKNQNRTINKKLLCLAKIKSTTLMLIKIVQEYAFATKMRDPKNVIN